MFRFEKELVNEFRDNLSLDSNPFHGIEIAFEFNYNNGRTDIIGVAGDGVLIAFEAKLFNWKKALHQAYRNSFYAHYSYVLLPWTHTKNAMKKKYQFERLGVGLCSIDTNQLIIEIPADKKDPLQPWLTNAAIEYITV